MTGLAHHRGLRTVAAFWTIPAAAITTSAWPGTVYSALALALAVYAVAWVIRTATTPEAEEQDR